MTLYIRPKVSVHVIFALICVDLLFSENAYAIARWRRYLDSKGIKVLQGSDTNYFTFFPEPMRFLHPHPDIDFGYSMGTYDNLVAPSPLTSSFEPFTLFPKRGVVYRSIQVESRGGVDMITAQADLTAEARFLRALPSDARAVFIHGGSTGTYGISGPGGFDAMFDDIGFRPGGEVRRLLFGSCGSGRLSCDNPFMAAILKRLEQMPVDTEIWFPNGTFYANLNVKTLGKPDTYTIMRVVNGSVAGETALDIFEGTIDEALMTFDPTGAGTAGMGASWDGIANPTQALVDDIAPTPSIASIADDAMPAWGVRSLSPAIYANIAEFAFSAVATDFLEHLHQNTLYEGQLSRDLASKRIDLRHTVEFYEYHNMPVPQKLLDKIEYLDNLPRGFERDAAPTYWQSVKNRFWETPLLKVLWN